MKKLRELLGMTQQEFAHFLGVGIATVWRWEHGKSKPSFTPGQWRKLLAEMKRVNLTLKNLPDDLSAGNHLILPKGG